MNISGTEAVGSIDVSTISHSQNDNVTVKNDFYNWISSQVNETNDQILTAESNLQKLAVGETDNLHHVMLSLEKAKTSMELVVQVRNKLLEGYQEIMRMQI